MFRSMVMCSAGALGLFQLFADDQRRRAPRFCVTQNQVHVCRAEELPSAATGEGGCQGAQLCDRGRQMAYFESLGYQRAVLGQYRADTRGYRTPVLGEVVEPDEFMRL